jgi:hypothetical protein
VLGLSIFSRGCSGSCTLHANDATLERAGFRSRTPTDRHYTDPNKVSRGNCATSLHSFISTRSFAPKLLSDSPSFSNASITPPNNTLAFSRPHCTPTPVVASTILTETTRNMSLAVNTNRPLVSSPLASPLSPSRQPAHPITIRNSLFPASRPLRPFPSIATAGVNGTRGSTKKPIKIIEPPKGYSGGCFVLNLTQAELSRRD